MNARDPHFSGVAKPIARLSGKLTLMAGPVYSDGTVMVLYGNGVTRELRIPADKVSTWKYGEIGLAR